MLATLIIVFREVIEAGLIISIVMAATRGVSKRGVWVSYGVAGGVLGACIVAAFAGTISAAMEGMGQELFNVIILSLAVLMLTWHNVWMARHGREIALQMKHLGEAVVHGQRTLAALAVVVAVAVLREGSEVVLFLYGIAVSGGDSAFSMFTGGALGLIAGAILGVIMYSGLLRIHSRHIFSVTGWLIALLAAGMAAQAVAFLQQAGMVESLQQTVWNTSSILSDGSLLGKTLHTLIGYTDQPTQLQLLVYVATLAVIFTLMRLFGHAPAKLAPMAAALVVAIGMSCSNSTPAHAFDVDTPYVEQGMAEIELKNRWDSDNRASEDNFRQHVLGVGYGFTSWWSAELEGEWEKEAGHGYSFNATEIENVFQLTDPGEYFLDVGAEVKYEWSHEHQHADEAKALLLLAKQTTQFTHALNVGLSQEVGDYKNRNPEWEAKWMTKYNYLPYFNPGIEYYGEFGEVSHGGDWDGQKHRFGPAIYGKLPGGFQYELGWLIGASKAAEDHAVKLNIEYEFGF